jgi:hypothetical protein
LADDIVRHLTITASQTGIAETTTAVKNLAAATDTVSKAQTDAAKATKTSNDALSQGIITTAQYDQNLAAISKKYSDNTAANDNYRKSTDSLGSSLVTAAAGLFLVQSAYSAVSSGADSASSSIGAATTALSSGIGAALMYLPNKIGEVWQEGTNKLDSYVKLNETAGRLSTDFYQRLVAGANAAKQPVQDIMKLLETANGALERNLGSGANQNGSSFNLAAVALQKSGNFQGLSAEVNRVNNSVTPEEQLKSGIALITAALDKGETLAAYKISDTLFGKDVTERLRQNNDYLFKMQASVESVKSGDLIKQADVDRSVGLKVQLDTAKGIIDAWFTKSASDWSGLGISIQQLWVNANTGFAVILTMLDSIFGKSKEIAAVKPDPDGSLWTKIGDIFAGGSFDQGVERLNNAARNFGLAEQSLASQMQNPTNITRAGKETQAAGELNRDRSRTDGSAASDQATAAILKNNSAVTLSTQLVGLNAAAQAQLKVEAQLDAAAIVDGLNPAIEKLTANYSLLVQQAMDGAAALDQATKINAAKDAYTALADSIKQSTSDTNLQIKFHGDATGLKEAQINAQLLASALKTGLSPEAATAAVAATGLGTAAGVAAGKLAALNKTEPAKDAYTKAEDAIKKYIEMTKAATATIGETAGVQEKAKVNAQLYAAAIKDGLTPAAAAAKVALSSLGEDAGLEKQINLLKTIQNDIKFQHDTAFLSPEDVAIANQLVGAFNSVGEALRSDQAEAIRFNNTLKTASDLAGTGFSSFIKDIASGVGPMQALESAAKNLANSVIDIASKKLAANLIGGLLGDTTTQTIGASASADILTTAGTALAASIVAGATEAATILGITIPEAAATLPIAGAATGTEVAVGGVTAGAALTAGGTKAGLALYGPIALMIAAVAALSFFGGNDSEKKAAEEQQKNVDAWKAMTSQVRDFNNAAAGFNLGPITSAINSLFSSYSTLGEAANKAKDYSGLTSLQTTFNQGVVRLYTDFALGSAILTPLQQSMKAVNDEASGMKESLSNLGLLSQNVSDIIDLGLNRRLTELQAAYKADAEAGLRKDINSNSGLDYINNITDEITKFNDLAKNGIDKDLLANWFKVSAQKIVDGAGLAGTALAGLISEFPQLAGVVTDSASAVTAAQDAIKKATAATISTLESIYQESVSNLSTAISNLTSAQDNLRTAYQNESTALQSTIDKTKTYVASLRELSDSLKLNPQLSTLTPQDQYLQAQQKARDDAKLAAGGNSDAQGRLVSDLNTYLNQSKSFNASSEAYYRDFVEVQNILTASANDGQKQIDVAQASLNALTTQIGALITINASVLSITQAISQLSLAQGAVTNATTAQHAAQTNVGTAIANAPTGTLSAADQVTALYNSVNGRAPDAAGAAYWTKLINNGLTGSDLVKTFTQASIVSSNNETINPTIKSMYGLALGGTVGNGIYNQDSVIARFAGGGGIALAGGEEVIRATSVNSSTLPALKYINRTGSMPGNDNASMMELGRIIATGNAQIIVSLNEVKAAYSAGAFKIADETRKAAKPVRQTGTNN